jgi:hypothetical protein
MSQQIGTDTEAAGHSTGRYFVGIDPGTTGCVAMISPDGQVDFWDTPTYKVKVGKSLRTVYDLPVMINLVRSFAERDVLVTIEEIHAMPTSGGLGNFSSGFGYGLWLMALAMAGLPHQIVQPAAWKKYLGLKRPVGKPKDSEKKAADLVFAQRLFPAAVEKMHIVKHHGRADSLLIAEYGRRSSGAS